VRNNHWRILAAPWTQAISPKDAERMGLTQETDSRPDRADDGDRRLRRGRARTFEWARPARCFRPPVLAMPLQGAQITPSCFVRSRAHLVNPF
jgi:hypothetical protein